jgi:phosphoribosylanthranilate isomerase
MIKVCGISDPATAQAAAEAGATAIGVVFSRSPRQVSLAQAARVVAELPVGIERVAVLRAADLHRVPEILRTVAIDALQVHGKDLPAEIHGVEVIPAGSLACVVALPHRRVLADSPSGAGSGTPWDYAAAAQRGNGPALILAGGLTPHNIRESVRAALPDGVDVSSGVEQRPGVKDHGLIREFVSRAREALTETGRVEQ